MKMQTKTALITGASRGLGLALAHEFAHKGWRLIINARGDGGLQRAVDALAVKTAVTAVSGDIANPDHRKALHKAAVAAGQIDVLINNAGVLGPSPLPSLMDFPLTQLAALFQVNVVAQLGVLQAVRDVLAPRPTIINVSSDAAVEAYAGWGGYGAGKAALDQLSAVLAAENPDWRIYWVDPGDMNTVMHQAAFPGEDISDRPLPAESVPGFMQLVEGGYENGRYQARRLPVAPAQGASV